MMTKRSGEAKERPEIIGPDIRGGVGWTVQVNTPEPPKTVNIMLLNTLNSNNKKKNGQMTKFDHSNPPSPRLPLLHHAGSG